METVTYTWLVEQAQTAPLEGGLTNVIKTLNWRVNALSSDNLTATAYGTVGLESPDPEAYVPYEGLEEETVVEWLKASLGEDQVEQLEANLLGEINKRRNPPIVTMPLPWV